MNIYSGKAASYVGLTSPAGDHDPLMAPVHTRRRHWFVAGWQQRPPAARRRSRTQGGGVVSPRGCGQEWRAWPGVGGAPGVIDRAQVEEEEDIFFTRWLCRGMVIGQHLWDC